MTVKREQILEELGILVRRELDWEEDLRPDQRLVEDLGLDSLRLLTLAVAVENHFEFSLDPQDEANLSTVNDLLEVIERRRMAR
jgi:acyl carrier protein